MKEVAAANTLTEARISDPVETCLWLIRHAEVEACYQGVFGGRIDMDLSSRGHRQAEMLGAYLQRKHLDALYASPMKRVQQTLLPLSVNGMPRPVVLANLREVDFGDWTGLAWEEVYTKFRVSAFDWLDQLECAGIPNAECSQTLRKRVEPCLRDILHKHPRQQVGIVCHGGVIRVLLSILLNLPLSRMAAFEIDYASITRVMLSPEKVRLELLNFTPWRDLPQ